MSAHTPGPWKAEVHRNGGATIRKVGDDAKNERGAIASLTFGGQTAIKADARLIAAAPELLAALRVTLMALDECAEADRDDGAYWNVGGTGYDSTVLARALLAKIDGAA